MSIIYNQAGVKRGKMKKASFLTEKTAFFNELTHKCHENKLRSMNCNKLHEMTLGVVVVFIVGDSWISPTGVYELVLYTRFSPYSMCIVCLIRWLLFRWCVFEFCCRGVSRSARKKISSIWRYYFIGMTGKSSLYKLSKFHLYGFSCMYFVISSFESSYKY